MVLRLTSAKVTKEPEPRDEHPPLGDERANERSGGVVRDGGRGSRDARSPKKVVAVEVALDLVLQEIVQQARLATMATGAFVGVVKAHKITRPATSGSNAGEFVNYLNRDRRMVDACLLRAGEVHICRDSETFEELDPNACRYLGARSVVMVPIADEAEKQAGVFGVFSPQVDAFSSASLVALQGLARRAADAMAQVERSTAASSEDAPALVQPATPLQVAPLRTEHLRIERRRPAGLARVAVWLVCILVGLMVVGWTLGRTMSRRAMRSAAKVSNVATAPMVSSPATAQASTPAAASLPPQPTTSQQASSDHPLPLAHGSPSEHASSVNAVANSRPSAARPSAGVVAIKPDHSAAKNNVKLEIASSAAAIRKNPPRSDSHIPELEIENALDGASAGAFPSVPPPSESLNPSRIPNPPSPGAAPRPVPNRLTTMNTGYPPVPANTASAAPPTEAIHITRAPDPPSASAPPQPSTPATNAAPNGPVVIPEKTALLRVVDRVKPDYPEDAMAQNVQGAVVVDVVVSKDGEVESVKPVTGDPRLVGSAAKAVSKWHFAPLLRNGHFVTFETHITLQMP